jgi:hypothetical protein
MQGEVAWFSPEMAGDGGVKKRSGEAALLVAGEGGDGVLQLEEETGDEGRSTAKGDDGQGWELIEGGSRRRRLHFRRHNVPPMVDRGQEARG